MPLKIYQASDVAKFFLSRVDAEENDISNLKLQKLCYYAQGLVSSMRGNALFSDALHAWDHGPVVESLYHEYKENKNQPIPVVENFEVSKIFDAADAKALEDIHSYYGQFSAWRLRSMTHEERPWQDAYNESQGSEIKIQSLIDFFRPQVEDDYIKSIYGKVV